MLCSITTICCAFSLATSDWWRNYLLPHHLYIFLRYKQKNKGIKFPGWWSQWILTIKVQVLDITRLRRQRTADVQTRCGSLRKLCLIGTSEHTVGLAVSFLRHRITGDSFSGRVTGLVGKFDRLSGGDTVLSVWFLREKIIRNRGIFVGIYRLRGYFWVITLAKRMVL